MRSEAVSYAIFQKVGNEIYMRVPGGTPDVIND